AGWIYSLNRELQNHKGKLAIAFAVVTLVVLIVGFAWPKKYEASAVVFADEQNIIKPLLSGSAEVTTPEVDQSAIARDRIMSNAILRQAVVEAKLAKEGTDEGALDAIAGAMRGGIMVADAGRGHIRISYRSTDAGTAFAMASALTNAFVRDTARAKRQESREAYTFIDNQVNTYREQLQTAEDKLKNFKGGSNVTGGDTAARMSQLRSEIGAQTLDLQVAIARRDELRRQISQEKQFVNRQYKSDGLRDRLAQAQAQLDTLRLSYNDTYPDIVSLKQQMQDLQKAIANTENQQQSDDMSAGGVNPVYAKLRGDLADAEVTVRTIQLKLNAVQKMLQDEQGASKQGAEYEAQLAELTRDYDVTKKMYESMLERKEKARLSVALDVEGQGVTYRIKEPPAYPNAPVGLRFVHFFLIAPVVGLLAPLAILVAYIQLDPRIRFIEKLEYALPESVQVLAVIPHMSTPSERRTQYGEWMYVGIFAAVTLIIYTVIGMLRIAGVV
ncbi:MAG TPA: XrtA system polysaccharide chain length determinant, partial [Spongiibacteraceae bacterium]